MNIKQFITPLLKWWWLIILSTLIAAGTSYWVVRSLPPVYLAHTTLMVGRAISDPNPSGNEFGTAQQLAIYYTNIAMREPIREATELALGVEELPKYSAVAVPYSPFIEISVTDTDPYRAMVVANELARELILQSPTAPQKEDLQRLEFLNEQLAQLQKSIIDTQNLIEQKQLELTQLTSATQIQDTQAEITALEAKTVLLQTNYAELLTNTQGGATNTLSIVEIASLPVTPIGPKKILITGLAALAGMTLALGVAYLIEFLDRTIKTPEDVDKILRSPILGSLPKISGNDNEKAIYFFENPRSPYAESLRVLRTNLGFVSIEKPIRKILISSVFESEGKTTVAINLALAYAQANKKVLLLDADLRRPNIHRLLEIPARPGISDAFQDGKKVIDLVRTNPLNENLLLLPAGKLPPNPTELLNSSRMDVLLADLSNHADLVIIDGPPLGLPDAAILASKVDGVLIIMQPGRVRYELAQKIRNQIQQTGGKLLGVVFVRAKTSDSMFYTDYKYYSYRDDNGEVQEKLSFIKRLLRKKSKGIPDEPAPETIIDVEPEVADESEATITPDIAEYSNEVIAKDPTGTDDLGTIEGIEPQVVSLLNENGISSFAQLAEASIEQLEGILAENKLQMINPDSWPNQAKLAIGDHHDDSPN